MFTLSQQEAKANPDIVTSILPVGPSHTRVIFDSGVTRSFMSGHYVRVMGMPLEALLHPLIVSTSLEGNHTMNSYV